MRVLIITSEEWNDYVYSNGVLTNWFSNFPAEFAHIYTSPGMPINNICNRYFQITDLQMLKSMFRCGTAGKEIFKPMEQSAIEESKVNVQRYGIYRIMKSISLYINTPVVMIKDLIWMCGRYNESGLKTFVQKFNPDIVFCPRKTSPKTMRLEQIVASFTDAPFVAFTGDDEASMRGKSLSPLYWIRKLYVHLMFKRHSRLYKHYMMHSIDQAVEYTTKYNLNTSVLFKSGNFQDEHPVKPVGAPIRLVYAGRLYCNRWKSLVEIGKALQVINRNQTRMVLDIYTTEVLTRKQEFFFRKLEYVTIRPPVTSSELEDIYKKADIALHVESLDRKYREVTRCSFSTKIIDLMASTCAILAICWEQHTGYKYLLENDAAICISDYSEILCNLEKICTNTNIISEYASKAYKCGVKRHAAEVIGRQMMLTFNEVIGASVKWNNMTE